MMNRRRIAKGYGVSLAVLLVVGVSAACTPDTSDASAPPTVNATTIPEETESDPAEAEMTWADGTPIEFVALDGEQAQPANDGDGDGDFEVKQTLPDQWENEDVSPMAMGNEDVSPMVSGDGVQVLITVVPEDNFDSATDGMKKHERVGILQGEDVTIFDTFRSGDAPRQALRGDIGQGYAAWLETPSTQAGTAEWHLWAQDLSSTDGPILVTTSDDAAGDAEPSTLSESALAISGDRVFWHVQTELEDGALGNSLMSAALTGGDVRVDADFGAAPVAIEGGVAVLQLDGDVTTGVSMLDSAGAAKELIKFGTTVADDASVNELAGDSKTVAFVLDGAAYIFNLNDQQAARIGGTSAQGLAVCNNLVTWTDSKGEGGFGEHQYVYNVSTGDLTVIDTPNNVGAGICSGDSILWASADGAGGTITKW